MIKFNEPLYDETENNCILNALSGTDYISKLNEVMKDHYKIGRIYPTINGSSAFEMAFALMDLPKGSEVIIPSFNYPSIGNTILHYGLKIVFSDVAKDDVIPSFENIKQLANDNTKCIVPVHYGGHTMDMDMLNVFAKENDIYIVEDAALSFGGEYNNRKLSTIGDIGINSFHKTKNISSDSGGLIIINNENLQKNASLIFNNGTNREEFYAGKAKMYSWKHVGMSIEMPNINAAMLYAQLEKKEKITEIRKKIYEYYFDSLSHAIKKYDIVLPDKNAYNKENYHVFHVLFANEEIREKVRLHLKSKQIHAHTHYVPLHLSDMGRSLGYKKGDLPNTEDVFERLLRLPLHNKMTLADAKLVVKEILEAL